MLDLLYKILSKIQMPVYTKYLEGSVKKGKMPRHIGIILDGNRRFARKMGLNYYDGYRLGAKKVEEILNWLDDLGIEHITLYVFSTENFDRPKEQIEAIMSVIEEQLRSLLNDLDRLRRSGIRFRAIGRLEMLPERVRKLIRELEEKTRDFGGRTLNIAVAYGGRREIVDSVRKIAEKVLRGELRPEEIDEEVIREHLYAPDLPDPDLIIRTSGEERLSNFLLWQSAYSELYFCEAYLPEFRKVDLLRAIRNYQRRERRYGR